jgi:undecaprenyl-diphosphatase
VWIVIALILISIPKTRKSGVCNAIALILCLLITNLCIKPLVDRLRPYEVEATLQLIVPRLSDGSFPSGHTCATFASVFVLSKYYKKWAIPLYIFACLMGVSRLYLCVHFPTDVIAGAILGLLFGYIAYVVNERIWSKRTLK